MAGVFDIKVLSPTHIGNGNTIKPIDIGEHDNYIYVFNLENIVERIPDSRLDEFSELIMEFGNRNKFNYKDLGEILYKEFGIEHKFWDSISFYKIRKYDKGRIHDLYEHIKYGNEVYIPGSSIKGTIRTAVIYVFLKNEGYRFSLEKLGKTKYLRMIKPNGKEVDGISDSKPDLSKIEKEIKKDMLMADATKDIFKCLQVSDSSSILAEKCLEARKVYVANTTSFTKRRYGRTISMHPFFVECIKVGQVFSRVKINVNTNVIKSLSQIYKEQRDTKETFEKIVELIKNWKECLRIFSQSLIEAEISFWRNNEQNIRDNIENTYGNSPHSYIVTKFDISEIVKYLNNIKNENPTLIRLGKFSGYLTHSIGVLIAENISEKPYNLQEFGKILSEYNKDYLFPLTRRVTLDNQTLGWCKLVEV